VHDLVDLDWAFVDTGRAQMRDTGACEIPGFVKPKALDAFVADARAVAPRAHDSGGLGTVYLGLPDESFPKDHPRQYLGNYGVGAVTSCCSSSPRFSGSRRSIRTPIRSARSTSRS
jgi:hypothetical protein